VNALVLQEEFDVQFALHQLLTFGAAMQKKRALALQQEWGDKPCDHPAFAKEYDNGERTGKFVCTQCGTTVTFREKAEIVASRSS
jgi:hypothetical protein